MIFIKLAKRLGYSLILSMLIIILTLQPVAGSSLIPAERAGPYPDEQSAAPSGLGQAYFVAEGGVGTECSKTHPGPLQYCVEQKAQSGDVVYVGDGIYDTDDCDDNLLFITKSIRLVGSCEWTPSGPVTCEPQKHLTEPISSRLDGEYERRVIAVQGPGISVTIENFVITRGNADDKTPGPTGGGYGGGIYVEDVSSLTVKNNYIWSNSANYSEIFHSFGRGGGLYAAEVKNLNILDNVIIFNSASIPTITSYGGGLYVESSGNGGDVKINDNDFYENMVGNSTTYSRAAGASIQDVENLQLDNNYFEYQNHTIRHDWIPATTLDIHNVTANSIDHNIFRENYGISIVEFSDLMGDFTRNKFWNNDSAYDLRIYHGKVINLINNFFGKLYGFSASSEDISNKLRGGISTLVYIGAGCGFPQVNIINNSFALAEYGVQMQGTVEVDILRNIFTSHSKKAIDVIDPGLVDVDVSENLFYANLDNGETGSIYWIGDPMFVDLFNGDFHLQPSSAAIDKVSGGAVRNDFDNQPRPMGFGVDLGADEFEDDIYLFLPLITR